MLTPDGRSALTATVQTGDHGHTQVGKIVEESVSTGKVQRVLHTATVHSSASATSGQEPDEVLSLGPAGVPPLVACFGLGWLQGTRFIPLPSGHGKLSSTLFWDAAW
jgi:hypothetical protein